MATRRFVIKCTGCSAPVTNVRRTCPYCGAAVSLTGLGGGVASSQRGHVTLSEGAHVVVGAAAGELRDCPHCGARVSTKDVNCPQCAEAVVLTSLWLRTLVVEKGASLTVERGGKVMIGRPGPAPGLARAASVGDLARVKERLRKQDDIDASDAQGKTPLVLALENGHLEVARFLIAMGATLDDADEAGRTPLHVAAQQGFGELVEVLVREGANPALKTRKGRKTPAQLAAEAGHVDLATRLSATR